MLEVARQSPCENKVNWIEGDALSLGDFNADLAIMTGHVAQFHLQDEYWLKALKSIHKALRSGGYLAFESRNPAAQPRVNSRKKINDPVAGEVDVWTEILEYKDDRITTELHYLFTKTGEELLSRNELKFRTHAEISQSLSEAGFSVENVFGDWDRSPASAESPEMIFVAKRG